MEANRDQEQIKRRNTSQGCGIGCNGGGHVFGWKHLKENEQQRLFQTSRADTGGYELRFPPGIRCHARSVSLQSKQCKTKEHVKHSHPVHCDGQADPCHLGSRIAVLGNLLDADWLTPHLYVLLTRKRLYFSFLLVFIDCCLLCN